jgi:hypothetical protein
MLAMMAVHTRLTSGLDAAFEISAHDNSTQPETIAFADTYADTYRGIVSFFGFSA